MAMVVKPLKEIEDLGFDGLADGFERGVLYEVFSRIGCRVSGGTVFLVDV